MGLLWRGARGQLLSAVRPEGYHGSCHLEERLGRSDGVVGIALAIIALHCLAAAIPPRALDA